MATDPNSTTTPKCTRATTAFDAIARVRCLGQGAFLALDGAADERLGLAVGAIVHAMLSELNTAEDALYGCRQHSPNMVDLTPGIFPR